MARATVYGPFWHYTSSTAVEEIVASGLLRGKPPRLGGTSSLIAKVKAWRLHKYPDAEHFVRFTTNVKPDIGTPPHLAYWSMGAPGVATLPAEATDTVAIVITIEDHR